MNNTNRKKKILPLIVTIFIAALALVSCETEFTVKFETDGGSAVASIKVERLSLIDERSVPVPVKSDYTFAGWYKDKSLSNEWNFAADKVTKNITLYAKYLAVPSAFKFEPNSDGQSYSVALNTNALSSVSPNIPSEYRGLPVTKIADSGFSSAKSMTAITIPASVTEIGSKAFYQCLKLETVTFEEGSALKKIGTYAFSEDYLITEISLPAGLETIDEYAFYKDAALKTVAFGEESGLESIGKYAFSECKTLTGVTTGGASFFPDSLKTVGDRAFYNNAQLADVVFSEESQLASIGSYSFYNTSLKEIFLPPQLTSMGTYAFAENKSVISVAFAEDSVITSIPSSAFANCTSLYSAELPASLTGISSLAFNGTPSLKKVVLKSYVSTSSLLYNARIMDGTKAAAVIVPDEYLADYKSKNSAYSKYIVSEAADETQASYTKIVDDSYLLYVEESGAKRSLIVYFGGDANVAVSDLTEIGQYAFAGLRSLQSVTVSGGNFQIGDYAFKNTPYLTSAHVSGVTDIGVSAFINSGLTEIGLGSALVNIGNSAFQDCKSLKAAAIPASVEKIYGSAFSGCSALETVTIADGSVLENIGGFAFYEAKSLKSINLPDSVTYIGVSAFSKCVSLTSVRLPAGLTKIEPLAFFAAGITDLIIPASVTEIGNAAFQGCSNLKSITFEDGSLLEKLGDGVFSMHDTSGMNNGGAEYNPNLRTVTLPASLTTVGAGVFDRVYVKVIVISSLVNAAADSAPNLDALLTQEAGLMQNGRVILINAAADSELYNGYKGAGGRYASDAFVASINDAMDADGKPTANWQSDGRLLYTDGGTNQVTLTAYLGYNSSPSLDGIYTVGKYAFAFCVSLEDIVFDAAGGGARVIEEGAFESCINLKTIEFTEPRLNIDSYSIGKYAFKKCTNTTDTGVILRGSTAMDNGGFYVDTGAFYGWTKEQTITLAGITSAHTAKWATNWGSATVSGNCYAVIVYE
ncbi:MAG: leucine-rich repeat protein [Clostridiales bacterium]|nr:leucine-rich repeat protein [Clostridiales bacterium]